MDFTAGGRGRRPDKGQMSIQLVKQVAQEMMRGAPPSPRLLIARTYLHAYHLEGQSLIAVFAALAAWSPVRTRAVLRQCYPGVGERSDMSPATPDVQQSLGRWRRCTGSVSQTIKNLQ